ncbi:hypothetical protein ACSBR2_038965 [Camellia fascicularis]
MSWLMFLHQFLLLFLWSSSTFARHTCLEDQRFSLLQFKTTFTITANASLGCESDSHPKMVFWNESSDCYSWEGVTCDWSNGHGTIQPNTTLFHLRYLQTFNLAFNDFNFSTISPDFGSFPSLTHLILSYSNFTGRIPSKICHLLERLPWKNLAYIDLHSNLLRGPLPIPPNTTNVFSISNNKLTGEIPTLICNLSYLLVLDLSNNSLSGSIPQCLGNLSNSLSVLNLGINRFRGTFTATFTKGNMLRNLNLNGNQIEGQVPQSLLNCRHLEVLDLGKNKINDTFPHWLGTLRNLFHGHMSTFKTKGKHPFPKLRIIDMSYNDFTGLLPTNYIKQFEAMMNVDEHEMKLKYMGETYYQDSVVVVMKGLEIEYSRILTVFSIIDLSSNNFQGEIPKSIEKLNSLRSLKLSHNNLTGHIPTSLGNLKNLESLDLSSNKLVGVIPQQLTSLTFLEVLNLSVNQLAGPIPQGRQFYTFENDSYNGNSALCGIPLSKKCKELQALPPLPTFQQDENSNKSSGFSWQVVVMGYRCGFVFGILTGYLMFLTRSPEWLMKIVEGKQYKKVKSVNLILILKWSSRMRVLIVAHGWGELQGTIQTNSSLFHLRQLQKLNLAFNHKLSWQTLQFIDLHSNLLHGPLPVPPITTIAFSISNNKLTGEIFPLICSLNLLEVLDLSNNNFSGIITHCFGNFSNSLSVLNLGMNSFHGTFTIAFTVGNMLRNLNLNGNHIEGQVPNSSGISGLVLRFNRFHGHIDAFKTKSKVPFTKLRIIDISYNEFSGLWPTNYIEKFEATMNMDEHAMKLKYMGDIYYYDYVVVIMKGHEIEFSRILTIISITDLSSNKFIGEIPKSIGRLNSLQDLNLSHNNLKGHIPTSLGNLKSLESLDLSSNKLTSLMFLECDQFLKGASLINSKKIHIVGTWPCVDFPYQRNVRIMKKMQIKTLRANLTGKL